MLRKSDIVQYQGTEYKIRYFVTRIPDDLDDMPTSTIVDETVKDILIEERENERVNRAAKGIPCNNRLVDLIALPENATHVHLLRTITGDRITVPIQDCTLIQRNATASPIIHEKYESHVKRVQQTTPRLQYVWI